MVESKQRVSGMPMPIESAEQELDADTLPPRVIIASADLKMYIHALSDAQLLGNHTRAITMALLNPITMTSSLSTILTPPDVAPPFD